MESIGAQLQQGREAKGATLSEAASATRIKIQHLECMEHDDFSTFAAAAYARGFIKIYAEYLEIPVEPLVRAYSEQHAPSPRRQGLSSDDIPEPAHAEADESAARKSGTSGSELMYDVGRVKRIAIPVVVVVVGVLLLTGLIRWFGSGPAPEAGEPGDGPDADVLILADPPDTYLGVSPPEDEP